MLEPFFGSGSPIWSGMSAPAFGWVPPSPALGGNQASPLATTVGGPSFVGQTRVPQPMGVVPAAPGLATAIDPYRFSVGMAAGAMSGLSGYSVPAYAQSDVVSAPALVAAIAMRRGQPQGPTNDQEIEDFIYDALEALPSTGEIDVRCEGGRVTLTGNVPHKRLKRDAGEIVWALVGVVDLQNNITITSRRRSRAGFRETEAPASVPARKQA